MKEWNQINEKVKESFPNIKDVKDGLLNFQKILYGENIFSNKDFIRIIYSPYKDGRMVQYKTSSKEVTAYYDTYEDFESIFEQYKKDVDFFSKNKEAKDTLTFDKSTVYEKLKEIYEAQEKHYNLMVNFEKMMHTLVKEHNKPYPSLHQVIGTYGDGIENVDLAMAEFEQQMRYIGLSLEEEEQEMER